jgi:hypothetical protein
MSAIQAVAAPVAAMMNPIETAVYSLNTNPYFIGIMMLLLNIGGRFIPMEISKSQERFLQSVWVRRFVLFTVFFIATRNVIAAIVLTMIVLLFMSFLLNENSSFYLFGYEKASEPIATQGLTPDEQEILRRLNEKHLKFSSAAAKTEGDKKEVVSLQNVYLKNLAVVQGFTATS